MKNKTCCFTGHRRLPKDRIEEIKKRLNAELERLILKGVTEFMLGGALGFDQMAASLVLDKKRMGIKVRLVFVLPCRNQAEFWTEKQKSAYYLLLDEADEVIYVSEEYTEDCMRKRNQYMVASSAYCVCALIWKGSGTWQTVNYARREGVKVVNVAE